MSSYYGSGSYGDATYGGDPSAPPPVGPGTEINRPPVLPSEGAYSSLELDFIDNEPPGLFPQNQDSYWGAFRKLVADYLTANGVDLFAKWYNNLDPRVVDGDDIDEWEYEVATPVSPVALTLPQRRQRVMSRLYKGVFKRAVRAAVVESYILPTFGEAASFTPDGLTFTSAGISLYSGVTSLTGTYRIVENIGAFSYDVRILNTITVDQVGLTRDLLRLTPAGISFTITSTATP